MNLERIKDILYDIGDAVIIIAIFALMIAFVGLKINHTLALDETFWGNNQDELAAQSELNTPDLINTNNKIETETEAITAIKPSYTNNTATETETETKNATASEITIVIPSGVSSEQIANILYENQLIDDKSAFIQTIIDKNLSNKLRAGTYNFNTSMNMDEVITKLTN